MQMLRFAAALVFLVSASAAQSMTVTAEWGPTKACFDPKSPPMTIAGSPAGTAKFAISMADLQSSFLHGGGTVAVNGGKLPYGAFSYKGPCPPAGQRHFYQFTVKALDAHGKILTTAKSAKMQFPPH